MLCVATGLNLIPEETRCDMTDFIAKIKDEGGRIGVFPIGENAWVDTGEWTRIPQGA